MSKKERQPKEKQPRVKKYTFRDRLPLLLAFAVPVFIMLIIFAGKGIYPFGEMSFLRIDLYHQYAPFHTDLLRRLQSGASLTYAWDVGLGSNYVALAAYYLCSPFNLLLFLISPQYITEYIGYMAILKTGLAGLTMAWYLCARSNKRSLSAAFFGICYAMCGFFAAYNWNIMWLDCLWLAPLVILGLERLVKENRPFLYCAALALSILTNYYISIMLCLFLVLYFICLLIMVPQKSGWAYLGKCGQFALFSLIGGGIAAVTLLPAYFALSTTASAWSKTVFPSSLTNYFSIIEMLGRHLPLVDCELGLEHWPNIYSGAATLIFLPMYYMNKSVSCKEKIVKTVLLLFLLFSFSFNIPNYIWHGLHYPNSLPCRQSFLYTIILLSMCHDGARGLRRVSPGRIAGIFFGCAGFILVAERLIDAPEFHYWTFWASLFFVGLYCLFLYLNRIGRVREVMAFVLMILVLIVETGVNTAVTSVTITSRTAYWDHVEDYQQLLADTGDTDLFYRTDKITRKSKDDGTFINYNSASIFSSTAHAGVSNIYKKLGMEGNTNAYCLTGSTPFTESLLSVKYRLSLNELPDSPLYELAGERNGAYLYRNLYTLPLGFTVSEDTENAMLSAGSNPAKTQNRLANLLGAEQDLLTLIPGSSSGSAFTTSVNERGHIYAFIENASIDAVDAEVAGAVKSFSNVKRRYLLDLGYCEPGTDIRLTTDQDETMNASVYMFHDDVFMDVYGKIAGGGLQLEGFENKLMSTCLRGTVTAKDDELLLLSIPSENGWTVKVDGAVTEAGSFSQAFLTVPLTAGTHTVELSYMPEGLKTGAFISLICLGLLLALFILYKLVRSRKKNTEEGDLVPQPEGEDYVFELIAQDDAPSPEDGEIHVAVGNGTEDGQKPAEILQMPDVAAAQVLAGEDAQAGPEETDEPDQAAPADDDAVRNLAQENTAALADPGTAAVRLFEAASAPADGPEPQAPETDATETVSEPSGQPQEDAPAQTADREGADIAETVAAQVTQIMEEPEPPEKEKTAANAADDLYKTRMLEQILSELESKD